jgi:hypothetical protein
MAGCAGSQNGQGLGIVMLQLGRRIGLDVGRLTVGINQLLCYSPAVLDELNSRPYDMKMTKVTSQNN